MISIHSNVRDYTVTFQSDGNFIDSFSRFPERLFVIDENVWRHHRHTVLRDIPETERLLLSVSEERKNLLSVMELYDHLMGRSAKKNMTLISIGGGIVQDITGFVASTLYRGLNWIFLPTTLLAQADSCIGSKTSLNYKSFKNVVGTFYPPAEVHIHPPFLTTLDNADFLSGLGEVVKLHVMGGETTTQELINRLPSLMRREPEPLTQVIRSSLSIKQEYMAGDEFDTGRRNLLNYGHCFGHALETASGYAIPHGQAVVMGMIFANSVSVHRGTLSPERGEWLLRELLLKSLSVPLREEYLDARKLLQSLQQDKKRVGAGLVMVLLRDDYSLEKVNDFSEEELASGISRLRRIDGL
jgi:3-dehydroquinate synthase